MEMAARGDGGAARTQLTVADRPLDAGAYSWGWVEYSGYGRDRKPQSFSVIMFDEPTDPRSMDRIRRAANRPRWMMLLRCYGPAVAGLILLMAAGSLPLVGQIALALTAVGGYQLWRHSQMIRKLSGAVEVWGDRSIEDYRAGREFLNALGDPAVRRSDLFAYFELRAKANELKTVLSDSY